MKEVLLAVAIVSAYASADPKPGILAAAPLAVAPAVVTATSSQSFIRNVASPFVAASAVFSPYVASPYLASPYVASPYAAPLVAF
ncbi:hypothetical protein NQ314_008673 [Rhamnusium bicolor]|uniref:Uncharacterized protein n=1 Tax=Rhamnusium bicolor TaxID=1586634 RepID=A0AAV8YA47_9CUCU|nr:hypothetical protein NQ314_008673 [Rhamnusium bicolor]